MKSLGSFNISAQESREFARISGDFNPLHLDAVTARRTQFGQTLIHGVCGTLKALDLWLGHTGHSTTLANIRVRYSKPVAQGQEVTVSGETTNNVTRLELHANGIRSQIIDVEISPTDNPKLPHRQKAISVADEGIVTDCVDLDIDDCTGLSGSVELFWDEDLMVSAFPNATRYLPAMQLATVIGSTQVVGMKCPGLHSVFAQLQMRFGAAFDSNVDTSGLSTLAYSVLNTDARIRQVELGLKNAYAQGTVEAFFRPPPVRQASFADIAALVSSGEFSDQNALVIGGSRGLGEVITKVLAAGGAKVMMTYAVGKSDADRVSAEIAEQRAAPVVCAYNVLEGSSCSEMTEFLSSVSHIYYLASPTIAKGDNNTWNSQLFSHYCDFYIGGLATLLQQVKPRTPGSGDIQMFIPSSIFLDSSEENVKGFSEYIAAKAAAEAYVQSFEKSHRNWRIIAPRLPRLHTDQTSGIRGIDQQETLNVIIEQLRQEFSRDLSTTSNAR